jgi:hypothetical protein
VGVSDFEETQRISASVIAGMDQMTAIGRTMFEVLAMWERACIDAGMSDRAAAAFTMKLADAYGWPPVGAT